jgi:hypothetical protein
MQMLMDKAMDLIKKEHMTSFTKHILVCDPSLGP